MALYRRVFCNAAQFEVFKNLQFNALGAYTGFVKLTVFMFCVINHYTVVHEQTNL